MQWESFEQPWQQNAASGEKWITTPSEKLTTSGVLMSGFFTVLPLNMAPMIWEYLKSTDYEVNVLDQVQGVLNLSKELHNHMNDGLGF